MTLQQAWQQQPHISNNDIFVSHLSKLKIIDIGYIDSLDASCSFAWVQTYSDRYYCEVISIGAFNDTVIQPTPGQYCLIFFPYTPTSLASNSTDTLQDKYSNVMGKCLPIGLCSGSQVAITNNGDSVDIDSPLYHAGFNDKSVSISSTDKGILVDFDKGIMSISMGTKVKAEVSQAGISLQTGLTVDTTTGTITDAKTSITIDTSGAVSLKTSDIQVEAESMSVKSENLTLDGDVAITGSLDVADGTFTVDKQV